MENNKLTKQEYINFHLDNFLKENGITPDKDTITREQLYELAEMFLDLVLVHGNQYIGIDGWLMHIEGCMLQEFIEKSRNHKWNKSAREIPELSEISDSIEEFRKFVKKYLGFEPKDGGYVETD